MVNYRRTACALGETMLRLPIVALLATITLTAAMPAEAAVHGLRWTATGVATNPAGDVFLIEVHYNGIYFPCNEGFRVTVKTLAGAIVSARSFSGYQSQTPGVGGGYIQQSFFNTGASTDPSVAFSYTGAQTNTFNYVVLHVQAQTVTGTYQGLSFNAVTVAPWDLLC